MKIVERKNKKKNVAITSNKLKAEILNSSKINAYIRLHSVIQDLTFLLQHVFVFSEAQLSQPQAVLFPKFWITDSSFYLQECVCVFCLFIRKTQCYCLQLFLNARMQNGQYFGSQGKSYRGKC